MRLRSNFYFNFDRLKFNYCLLHQISVSSLLYSVWRLKTFEMDQIIEINNKMYPRLENKFCFNEVHKIFLDDLDAD